MSLSFSARIESLVIRLAQEFKAVHQTIGPLWLLEDLDAPNLASAISILNQRAQNLAAIDDELASITTVYSSSHIVNLLNGLKNEILGGAGPAFDTLLEIQQALESGTTGLDALLTAVNNRVRFDNAQTLTAPQQEQARANIGAASVDQVGPDQDFVAVFNTALV